MYLTSYNDCLASFCEPLTPLYIQISHQFGKCLVQSLQLRVAEMYLAQLVEHQVAARKAGVSFRVICLQKNGCATGESVVMSETESTCS